MPNIGNKTVHYVFTVIFYCDVTLVSILFIQVRRFNRWKILQQADEQLTKSHAGTLTH